MDAMELLGPNWMSMMNLPIKDVWDLIASGSMWIIVDLESRYSTRNSLLVYDKYQENPTMRDMEMPSYHRSDD